MGKIRAKIIPDSQVKDVLGVRGGRIKKDYEFQVTFVNG